MELLPVKFPIRRKHVSWRECNPNQLARTYVLLRIFYSFGQGKQENIQFKQVVPLASRRLRFRSLSTAASKGLLVIYFS